MSEVYEAFDEHANRTVAVKLMLAEPKMDAQLAIFAEARSLIRFRHPHVVGFYGVGVVESQPFLELENVPGGSLAERMDPPSALGVPAVLEIMIRAADGLAALHDAGIVHRDIKADNVLLADDGRPVIADFGLAMHAENLPALPQGIVGTPAYMAPEAILGITESFEQYALADQYSFAVTTYVALTGSLPFTAATPSGLFYAQMALEPDPPSSRNGSVPSALDPVLLRAMSKRPNLRFPCVRELRAALAVVRAELQDSPTTAAQDPRSSGVRSTAPSLQPTVVYGVGN
jgi:serine/threonine-protein kinase